MKLNQLFIALFFTTLFTFGSCSDEADRDEFAEKTTRSDNGINMSLFKDFDDEVKNKLMSLKAIVLPLGVDHFEYDPPGVMLPEGDINMHITAYGTFSYTLKIRFSDFINDIPGIVEGELQGDGTSGSTTLQIPAYYGQEDEVRILFLEYFDIRTNEWERIAPFQQPAAYLKIGFKSNMSDPIPAEGGTYTITKTGSYPEAVPEMVFFRAITESTALLADRLVLTKPDQQTIDMTIPANEESSYRMVYVEYSLDYNEWVKFETHMQSPKAPYNQLTDWRVVSSASDPVNGYGGTALISLTGNYSELPIRISGYNSNSQQVILCEEIVRKGEFPSGVSGLPDGFEGAVAVRIPAYEENGWPYDLVRRYQSTSITQWNVQVYINGEWITLESKDGYSNTIEQATFRITISEQVDNISKEYTQWPFKIQGYWDNPDQENIVWIRLVTNPGEPLQSALMEMTIDPHTQPLTAVEYTISVPDNLTGRSRVIYMIFSLDGGETWNTWYQGWTLNRNGNGMLIQNG